MWTKNNFGCFFSLRSIRVLVAISVLTVFTLPAAAQTSRRHDPNQPIQINADALEVRQDQSVAIFSGNVDAVQGNIRLQAAKLKVFYQRKVKGDKNADGNTISKIVATGGVFVSTPTETAKGSNGVYNVENRTITLFGNVVLTQGKNAIRGKKLTLNMETGFSRLEGDKKERVKAVVHVPPKEKKKKQNQ